ncbi:MAG TPA: hypothetical protein P5136_02695 [Methanofastidiosum sp.]|nr:hypothetical protein [Methanofastidiosum sp.]
MSYFSHIKQDVVASTLNSSTGNIAAGATFTGLPDSTLGIAGIQVSLYADQNCRVYVEQSPDTTPTGPHWDISDYFNTEANVGFGITVQAVSSYVRVRVENLNTSTGTTVFRLQTALCPIVEAVPRTLDPWGNFKVAMTANTATEFPENGKTNLTGSEAWVGTYVDTRNNTGIQIISKFDQDTTVYVDQSLDAINAFVTDSWESLANTGFSITVTSVAPYYRLRVTNKSTSAATGSCLSATIPVINPLPRKLDETGNLLTSVHHINGQFDKNVIVSPIGALKVYNQVRLVGTGFTGSTVDTNFWATTPTNGGTATQTGGVLTVSTATTANGACLVQSSRLARYTGSVSNNYRANINLPAVTTASAGYSNVRRWGVFDANDGFFFKAVQTNPATTPTLSVVCRKASSVPVDTNTIDSGSFNGNYGPSYTLDNNAHTYEIYWTNKNAWFVIDDVILHTFTGTLAPLVDTPSLKIGLESVNSGGNTAANTLQVRSSTINRQGSLITQPTHKYNSGNTAGIICKYGPGNLIAMTHGATANASVVTIYDGTTTGGTIMYQSAPQSNGLSQQYNFNGIPFFTGLFFTQTGGAGNVILIYE